MGMASRPLSTHHTQPSRHAELVLPAASRVQLGPHRRHLSPGVPHPGGAEVWVRGCAGLCTSGLCLCHRPPPIKARPALGGRVWPCPLPWYAPMKPKGRAAHPIPYPSCGPTFTLPQPEPTRAGPDPPPEGGRH